MGKSSIAIFLCIATFTLAASPSFAQSPSPTPSESKPVIVKLKAKPKAAALLSLDNAMTTGEIAGGIASSEYLVITPNGNAQDTVDELKSNALVQAAFVDPGVKAFRLTNDTSLQNQWALEQMKVKGSGSSAWDAVPDIANKTATVKVAVIDSGVDRTHPDISGKLADSDWYRCFSSSSTTVDCVTDNAGIDDNGHGTHVAGIVAATPDNNTGIAGVGWNVKLMSIKVLGADGSGDLVAALAGMIWAADHGAKVINMSLGNVNPLDTAGVTFIQNIVNETLQKGALIVAASGNCGSSQMHDGACNTSNLNDKSYPAASTGVLSVAALAPDSTLAPYANHNDTAHGNWVSVAAPGGLCTSSQPQNCILSTWARNAAQTNCSGTVTNAYCYLMGTSQASPQVAGLAALIWAKNPTLTNTQVKQIIESTANHALASSVTTNGAVDGLAAVQAAGGATTAPTNTPAPTVTPGGPTITPSPTPTGSVVATGTPTPTPSPSLTPTPTRPQTCTTKPLRSLGNANDDCYVDLTDYSLWASEVGTAVQPKKADFNVDGKTDLSDYEIWRRNTDRMN